ncbi:hypothetical protein BP6252_09760 [Coleophoma cylindrospora]|uniref:Uncharacterized protein n=1 Tax=Coleophoma cylindrospora TaxID=1849047 RepID=A0A3D8QWH3_9HELO|nr:hypothetical protein BP6252_09760 [Coleophoma cylindrospora]
MYSNSTMYGKMSYSYSPSPPSTSYSSTPAMEIPSTSSARSISTSTSCAYPSWPRRASLSNNNSFETANSYISDDELFPLVFDDADTDSNASPMTSPTHSVASGADQLQSTLWMKELMAEEKARKHREREASKRRSRSSSSRKSRNSTSQKMTPILE